MTMTVSLKPAASRIYTCDSRFRVLAAGRQFGKTYLACIELCRAALGERRLAWFASMAPQAWTEVLRPALSDRLGRALFIGSPNGRNHFYELFEASREQKDWKAFQYTTENGGCGANS